MYQCSKCNFEGKRKLYHKGTFSAEVLIWLIGIILAFFTMGLALIIPIIYSVWRLGTAYRACPKCESKMYKV